jgi:flavin-dependent dehydrogenase
MTEFSTFKPVYDAIIVGARCAGAATALLLARSGARVLVVDRQAYGSDRISTHALMRGGVLQLNRWGVLPELMSADTPPVRKTTFHYGEEEIPIAIGRQHGVDFLCAPRRTVLDRVLVDAARRAGADIRHGISVVDLQRASDGRVTGVVLKDGQGATRSVAGDVVVGADGRQSLVARKVEAPTIVSGTAASGYVYGYFEGLPDDGTHWYFADGVAAGMIPTTGGQHCIFVGVPQHQFADTFRADLGGGFRKIASANSPALGLAIGAAHQVERLRGFGGGIGFLRQAHGPGWALVGDAGYFKDPLTAHGITDALRDAELLANAILDGRRQAYLDYQSQRDGLSMELFRVTDEIATFNWSNKRIKDLHHRLSATMKAEADRIAGFRTHRELAA